MLSQTEIDALARDLIGQHGPFAPQEAERRALRMSTQGDKYGVQHWRRIKTIVERMLAAE